MKRWGIRFDGRDFAVYAKTPEDARCKFLAFVPSEADVRADQFVELCSVEDERINYIDGRAAPGA